MIEGFDHGAAIGLPAQLIETHGIQPFEDVTILAMLRGAAMLVDETLNLLEPGDDPFLARRPAGFLLCLGFDAKLGKKLIILVGESFRHARPPPSYVEGRPRPRPCAFPTRPAT
ncbi:MAG: hypothetical protein WBA62_00270 [Xanthobacteraceae bacterium]